MPDSVPPPFSETMRCDADDFPDTWWVSSPLSLPPQEAAEDANPSLKSALEMIAMNDLYHHFGVQVLDVRLWRSPVTSATCVAAPARPDLLPFPAEFLKQLKGSCAGDQPAVTVPHAGTESLLPVVGFGQLLAASAVVGDNNPLGFELSNVRYVVTYTDDHLPLAAQVVKLVTPASPPFTPAPGRIPCPDTASAPSTSNNNAESVVDSLESDPLMALLGRCRIPTQQPADKHTLLRFIDLPSAVQDEFLDVIRQLSECELETFAAFYQRAGMGALCPAPGDALERAAPIFARVTCLLRVYASSIPCTITPTSSSMLLLTPLRGHRGRVKAPVLSALKLTYSRWARLRDPVSQSWGAFADRFVRLSHHINSTGVASVGNAEGSLEAARDCRTSVDLSAVFGACAGATKRINVIGSAGAGKSTWCQWLVNRWCGGTLPVDFDLVLLVPLRRLTSSRYPPRPSSKPYDVLDIVMQECLGQEGGAEEAGDALSLRAALQESFSPDKTLWILDGYDEVVDGAPPQLEAALQSMLQAPHRVLTGRPHSMMNQLCDVVVELAGFNDGDIQEYITRYSRDAQGAGVALLEALQRNKLAWELAHIPINLVLLCHVFEDRLKASRPLEECSLTELYIAVEDLMLRRYVSRQQVEGDAEAAAPLPPPAMSPRRADWLPHCVAVIAFESMQAGLIVFPQEQMWQWLAPAASAAGVDVGDMAHAVLDSGFVTRTGGSEATEQSRVQCRFLHLTLQEYFAGKRVMWGLTQQQPLSPDHLAWLKDTRCTPRVELLWLFAAGMLVHCTGCGVEAGTAAEVGIPSLLSLWEDALPGPRHSADASAAQDVHVISLWLQIAEEWSLEASTPAIRDHIQPVFTALCDRVVSDVLAFLAGRRHRWDVPWCAVLRQCPNLAQRFLLNNGAFADELITALRCKTDYALRIRAFEVLEDLGDVIFSRAAVVARVFSAVSKRDADAQSAAVRVLASCGPGILHNSTCKAWLHGALKVNDKSVPVEVCRAGLETLRGVGPALLRRDWLVDAVINSLQQPRLFWSAVAVLHVLGAASLSHPRLSSWICSAVCDEQGGEAKVAATSLLVRCGAAPQRYAWTRSVLNHVTTLPPTMAKSQAISTCKRLQGFWRGTGLSAAESVSLDDLRSLCGICDAFMNTESVVVEVLAAFNKLAANNRSNCELMVDFGTVPRILAAMDNHIGSRYVQYNAAAALRKLVANSGRCRLEIVAALGRDATTRLRRSVDAHFTDPLVTETAQFALQLLNPKAA